MCDTYDYRLFNNTTRNPHHYPPPITSLSLCSCRNYNLKADTQYPCVPTSVNTGREHGPCWRSTDQSEFSYNFLRRTRILHTRPQISYLLNFRLKFATIDIDVASSNNFSVIKPMFVYTRNDILTSIWRHTDVILLHGSWTRAVNTGREHGPWTWLSKMTPVFTGRVHGPWTRVVCIGL